MFSCLLLVHIVCLTVAGIILACRTDTEKWGRE